MIGMCLISPVPRPDAQPGSRDSHWESPAVPPDLSVGVPSVEAKAT